MPVTEFAAPEKYCYLNGFGSYHESEAIGGALPVGANSPQKCPFGLYAEKISGTAFTAPRHESLQSWLYRILPSASHSKFEKYEPTAHQTKPSPEELNFVPHQLRWDAFDYCEGADWVAGLRNLAGAGNPVMKSGLAIYVYGLEEDMAQNTCFYSADGDFLIVPQDGALDLQTEFGNLLVRPNEIAIIPRGVRYRVTLPFGRARGYALELYEGHFTLPELGAIGSNCLANQRDFQVPTARFDEDTSSSWRVISKFCGVYFVAEQMHTPFDVVAWHGRYYPYKYDLGRFNTIGSISFDHPDPSIFTVLTAPSDRPETAIVDFVIFPPRWLVQEDTFRPPWYHRNIMAEFMGLISGAYDAKDGQGFAPGGASLHNVMSGHGPDATTFEAAVGAQLRPQKIGENSMAFMFETSLMLGVTSWGLETCKKVQEEYTSESWVPLKAYFNHPESEASK